MPPWIRAITPITAATVDSTLAPTAAKTTSQVDGAVSCSGRKEYAISSAAALPATMLARLKANLTGMIRLRVCTSASAAIRTASRVSGDR